MIDVFAPILFFPKMAGCWLESAGRASQGMIRESPSDGVLFERRAIQNSYCALFMVVPPGLEDGYLRLLLPYGRPSGTQPLCN